MHRPTARLARPARRALLAAAIAVLAACGGDSEGGGDGASDGAGGDPAGFRYEAARHCTDVVNGVDHATAQAAADANIELLEAVLGDDEPTAEARDDLRDRIADGLEMRRGVRARLAELEPEDDADADAWAAIVGAGDSTIEALEARLELLATGDWATITEEFVPGAVDGGGDTAPQGAPEELGLAGRDCEIVTSTLGNPPEHAAFLEAASSACTTIVSRRAADGYATDVVLRAVAAQAGGEGVTSSPELLEQLDAVTREWEQTVEDLEAVPTEDAPDAAAWEDVLAASSERAEVAAGRRQALEDGDDAEIERLFTPGAAYEHPGLGELAALGLDRRDCRSIEP